MRTKFKKVKPPTWKQINSEINVPSKMHRKENEKIKNILKANGFIVWDHCNVYMEGYKITARKLITEFYDLNNPYMYFSWGWLDHGTEFWEGELGASFRYVPDQIFSLPIGRFEITGITQRTIGHLSRMESRVISAIKSQTIL